MCQYFYTNKSIFSHELSSSTNKQTSKKMSFKEYGNNKRTSNKNIRYHFSNNINTTTIVHKYCYCSSFVFCRLILLFFCLVQSFIESLFFLSFLPFSSFQGCCFVVVVFFSDLIYEFYSIQMIHHHHHRQQTSEWNQQQQQ